MRISGSANIEDRLVDVYNFIYNYSTTNNFPPTIREIATCVNVSSTATVNYYINKLIARGLIVKSPNKSRAIELVGAKKTADTVVAPLIGRISAGLPILAVENIDDLLPLPAGLFNGNDLFALKVVGSSMIDAGIFNDDIIVVKKQSTANNGEIVAAYIDGDVTVKRIIFKNQQVILHPENKLFDDMLFSNVEILGVVVGSIRKFN